MKRARHFSWAFLLSLLVGFVMLGSSAARAAPPKASPVEGGLLDNHLKGKNIRKRGTIAQMRGHKVKVAGKTMSVGDLEKQLFADQDELSKEFKAGRSALLADPEEESDVVELDNATVLVKSTKVTIVDPDKLAGKSKRFDKFRVKRQDAGPKVTEFDAASKKEFLAWKKETLAKLPRNHPLREAAKQGDDALLEAVADGKGDLRVTTTVVVPKNPLEVSKGYVKRPKRKKNGEYDFDNMERVPLKFGVTRDTTENNEREAKKATRVTKTGDIEFDAVFITGDTIGENFEWSKTWKFTSGHFRLSAGAHYAFGVRAPFLLETTMTPKKLKVAGPEDKEKGYRVSLRGKTIDATPAQYRDAGMAESKIHQGHELVLEAGFSVSYNLKAGWGAIKKSGSFGKNFDFGQNFRPPYGDGCSASKPCGVDIWIDPKLTRTSLKLGTKKWFVKGSISVGFRVAGDGEVKLKYESIYANGQVLGSALGSVDGQRKQWRNLEFKNFDKQVMFTKLPTLDKPGTRNYGFHVWEPRYTWDVEVTPGVRADVRVKAGKYLDRTYTAGPLWLDALTMDLGTVKLPPHKGTKSSYKVKLGEKTWVEK